MVHVHLPCGTLACLRSPRTIVAKHKTLHMGPCQLLPLQAACALLVHAAQEQPLLPVAPAEMAIMVQVCALHGRRLCFCWTVWIAEAGCAFGWNVGIAEAGCALLALAPFPCCPRGSACQPAVRQPCLLGLADCLTPPLPSLLIYTPRLLQLPTPEGYHGNATHTLPVSLPRGTKQPDLYQAALAQLAGAIRGATAAFRAAPVSLGRGRWRTSGQL